LGGRARADGALRRSSDASQAKDEAQQQYQKGFFHGVPQKYKKACSVGSWQKRKHYWPFADHCSKEQHGGLKNFGNAR